MSKKSEISAKIQILEAQITDLVNKSMQARKEGRQDEADKLLQKAATVQNEWKQCAREITRLSPEEMTEEERNAKYSNAIHIASLKARGMI